MARKERIFTSRKRRVYRKQIPRGETIFGGCFVVFVIVSGGWFLSKKDDYNPEERDISIAALEESAVEDNLYRIPLEPWTDPADRSGGSTAPRYRLGLFPESILEGEWTPSSRLQTFNESNLFEKINGAAPQYFQFGFKALNFISIKKTDTELEMNIELYDMTSLPNAIGIFAAQRDDDQVLETLDKVHFFETSAGAIGVVNNFYFKLTGNQNSSQMTDKARSLIKALNEIRSGASAVPEIFGIFSDRLKIPFERIIYERQDVFQFDFAKDFWFARPDPKADFRYYVHEGASESEAQQLFDRLYEENLFDYTLVNEAQNGVVLKHNFLGTFLALTRNGAFIFGVENAPDEAALGRHLNSLTEALF
jgi:hypothetical protein